MIKKIDAAKWVAPVYGSIHVYTDTGYDIWANPEHLTRAVSGRRTSAKRKSASRSKPKRAYAKKRAVTRLKRVRAGAGRRGFGVLRHGAHVPSRVPQQNSYRVGPYSEYGPAHEKALRIESAGGRGMVIEKRRGGWYIDYVSPKLLH